MLAGAAREKGSEGGEGGRIRLPDGTIFIVCSYIFFLF
jgi:hypothetical protein